MSIIVPVYNRREMLEHALASIGAQTYSDIEVIVVDDGSDDLSAPAFASLCETSGNGRKILYVHKPNAGAASARNVGVAHATGSYLYFLDSDDLIFPDAIENLVSSLSGSSATYAVGRIVDVDYTLERVIGEFHQYDTGNILRSAEWCTHASLYRKEAILAVGPFDETLRVGEDTIFQIQMKLTYGEGARCTHVVGVRRRHGYGHLSLDPISPDEQAKFLVAAARLISRNDAFRRERQAVRLTSMALFIEKLAKIRRHRKIDVDRAFAAIADTLLHDNRAGRLFLKWLSAPGANLRLLTMLALIMALKKMRSGAFGLRRLRAKRELKKGALSAAMKQMSAATRLSEQSDAM